MSWFSSGGMLDEQVERATSESLPNGEIDLALNLEICDMIRSKSVPAKDAMRSLKKRLNHKNPNVQLLTLKLTDACVKNGGYHFLIEIASREFVDNLVSILKSPGGLNSDVKAAILDLIQTWASVFDGQMQLQYVGTVYKELKSQGFDFPEETTKVSTTFIDSSAPPDWTDSEVCMRCRTPFSFTNRKHHCRNCGNAFDQNCSSKSIPLPHLGITQPVRVCDSCYALKHKSPHKHHRLKSEDKKKPEAAFVDDEDDDLKRALRMSLEESKQPMSGYTVSPPAVQTKPAAKPSTSDYEDPDIMAAIEASLRDMEQQKKAKESTPAPVDESKPAGPTVKAAPPPNQLSLKDIENINLFSILVDHLPADNPSAILRDPKLQELYDNVTSLRPKFSRNVVESIGKYDTLLEMYQKLSTAMRYYDQMLEARLGYAAYGRHY
ncbi:hypothetical protein POJ06DRAFT_66657 [Lipomyces tetrasporus]|uniref:Vacuolar protein sorting-associated protein 27 n=1 Tax=Lipomyces tetrasporus TaxID=54092 RepID=A0AAD7VVR1_9ASCO|nr:uncharacterized protein POJ06DRAFT_66657 [Lipomyces tetrasporus]KAJ8103286.1 hypothetical protein POJ06DRAFT_66657 [Lipomyces tetrasporus]